MNVSDATAEPVTTVRDEVIRVVDAVTTADLDAVAALLTDRDRRWFCSGQGRSGLVAQMTAMRLVHAGFTAHAVGEATSPAVAAGDVLVLLSGSGTTPTTVHFAELGRDLGAHVLAVTAAPDGRLASLADTTLVVPAGSSRQFGGTLFEQSSLLVLDALLLGATGSDPATRDAMQGRHANLQ